MRAARLVCAVVDHRWVLGRLASSWARELVPGWPCYHNRACTRCGVEQWRADEAERDAQRIQDVRRMLRGTRGQAEAGDESV